MTDLNDLPDLPPAAPLLLAGLAATLWLAFRIQILRRQWARHGGEGTEARPPKVRAWPWLRALARRSWILPALGVLAVGWILLLVLTWH